MKKYISIIILVFGVFSFFFPLIAPFIIKSWFVNSFSVMSWVQENVSRNMGPIISMFPFIFPALTGFITGIGGIINWHVIWAFQCRHFSHFLHYHNIPSSSRLYLACV